MTIKTRYIPSTLTKSARIQARAYGRSKTLTYNTHLDMLGNHLSAAKALAEKEGLTVRGITRNEKGFVFTAL